MIELMPPTYRELRECFDDLRYGGFMRTHLLGLGSLSMLDDTRTPPGKGRGAFVGLRALCASRWQDLG